MVVLLCVAVLGAGPAQPPVAQAQEPVSVTVDGLPVTFDVPPTVKSGRTLVPFRAIAEALNVRVDWDAGTKTISATDGKTAIRLQIGNKTVYRNEEPIGLDVPPQVVGGRVLVPLRFFGEAFACNVTWDEAARRVEITSPAKEMTVIGFYALGDSRTSSWTNLFGRPYPETSAGNTDAVGELAPGWYSLDGQGNLLTRSRTGWQRPEGWEKVLEADRQYELRTEMVVHVTDQDGTLSSLLADPAARSRAATAIAQEARLYQGVNLDFEGLGYRDRNEQLEAVRGRFTEFVRLLAGELEPLGLTLTLTLHAPNSAYQGYDYRALGELADRIIVMAYDYGAVPEPVGRVRQAVETARAAVAPEKLVLGISVPNETPQSLVTKVGIAKRYGLAGIALWRLGLVSQEMWSALRGTAVPRRGEAKS
ncbi:MAG: stalk domain-containing protein [Moorellales bacterium]